MLLRANMNSPKAMKGFFMTESELFELAQFLKEKRVGMGLSQKDVADKLGYSTSQFISNWERGVSHPPLHTLRKLSDLYKISADEMFSVLLKTTIAQVETDLKRKFYVNDVSL
jgi:transcriptional regulator with XRE-family HTH domain